MSSSSRDESNIDAATVRARMRLFEDHNMALRLQDEEYNTHYDRNRTERRLVGGDTRKSKAEQEREKLEAVEKHRRQLSAITQSDEEVARQLQAEIEREEKRIREFQLARDEELARRLQKAQSPSPSSIPPASTSFGAQTPGQGRSVRGLLTGDPRNLDEEAQNELNQLADPSLLRDQEQLITVTQHPQTTTFGVRQTTNSTNHLHHPQQQPLIASSSSGSTPPLITSLASSQATPPYPNPPPPLLTPPTRLHGVPLHGLANPRAQIALSPDQSINRPFQSPIDTWPTPPPSVAPGPFSQAQPSIGHAPSVASGSLSFASSFTGHAPSSTMASTSTPCRIPYPMNIPSVHPATPPTQAPPLSAIQYSSHLAPEPTFSSSVGFSSPLETAFSDTNPFLADIQQAMSTTSLNNDQTSQSVTQYNVTVPTSVNQGPPPAYYSEFGLPPPSALANGNR